MIDEELQEKLLNVFDKRFENYNTKVLKELDDKLKDKEKRWEKVKQYIANIYDLDLEEDYDW